MPSHKRKLDEDDDMLDAPEVEEEPVRKKRSRPDMTITTADAPLACGTALLARALVGREQRGKKDEAGKTAPNSLTPPILERRTSGTPVLGVELQIPSRPATPIAPPSATGSGTATATSASALSTPKTQPSGKSPLIPAAAGFAVGNGAAAPADAAASSATVSQAAIDEDEWAAFEAEMINNTRSKSAAAATLLSADAVISAPAMTAEEIVAKATEEDQEKRRALADIELEDEKEDATRALEAEFEEMEELEARVRKLKERREALRQQGAGSAPAAAAGPADAKARSVPVGKENEEEGKEEEDEDEDDEDEDDWAGFRFRG